MDLILMQNRINRKKYTPSLMSLKTAMIL